MKKIYDDIVTIIAVLCLMALTFSTTVWGLREFKGFSSSPPQAVAASVESAAADLYRVTAYCPCEKCCGKWADGFTASGKPAVGKIVAAPPIFPFGTRMYIPQYGQAVVQDRGGAITGNRLDVLFPTHEEALQWGVKYLKVRTE